MSGSLNPVPGGNAFLFADNAVSTLAAAINTTATTLTVATGQGARFPLPAATQQFAVTLNDVATGSFYEIVYCTHRSGDVFTVLRGQEGTTAQNWLSGDLVRNGITAGQMAAMLQTPMLGAGTLNVVLGPVETRQFVVAEGALQGIGTGFSKSYVFSWQQVGSGLGSQTSPYITTYTVPQSVTVIEVELWGGGGGVDAPTFGDTSTYSTPGGAGGGYARKIITGLTPGQVITVAVGQIGLSFDNDGEGGYTPGYPGGTSSFGSFVSATGGGVGSLYPSTKPPDGGMGVGGDLNVQGGAGELIGTGNPSYPAIGIGGCGGRGGPGAGALGGSVGPGYGGSGGPGLVIVWW